MRERTFPKHTFFVVGGARSGTVMHTDPHHTSAWNTLLCGRKRWILIPPTDDDETLEKIGVDRNYRVKAPPCQWWVDVYPQVSERQRDGLLGRAARRFVEKENYGGWMYIGR